MWCRSWGEGGCSFQVSPSASCRLPSASRPSRPLAPLICFLSPLLLTDVLIYLRVACLPAAASIPRGLPSTLKSVRNPVGPSQLAYLSLASLPGPACSHTAQPQTFACLCTCQSAPAGHARKQGTATHKVATSPWSSVPQILKVPYSTNGMLVGHRCLGRGTHKYLLEFIVSGLKSAVFRKLLSQGPLVWGNSYRPWSSQPLRLSHSWTREAVLSTTAIALYGSLEAGLIKVIWIAYSMPDVHNKYNVAYVMLCHHGIYWNGCDYPLLPTINLNLFHCF